MTRITTQPSFTYEELIECAKGNLFGEGNAQLPMPPMLMVDRIVSITEDGGKYGKGSFENFGKNKKGAYCSIVHRYVQHGEGNS